MMNNIMNTFPNPSIVLHFVRNIMEKVIFELFSWFIG